MMKRRSALTAATLNLLFPPLGFVYVGTIGYACAYLIIAYSCYSVAFWTRAIFLPLGLLTIIATLIGLWFGAVALAAVLAHRQGSVTPPRWYVYLLFIVGPLLLTGVFQTYRVAESYRIRSGSMMPTMLVGDHILVDTTSYDRNVQKGPSRGDVVVFFAPDDPATLRAKRIVGLPGDHIAYHNKVLYINGEKVEQEILGTYSGIGAGAHMTGASLRREVIGKRAYQVLLQSKRPTIEYPERVVPEDYYFVLGDNRDNSLDSRIFGVVHRDHVVGEIALIYMHIDGQVVEGSWRSFKVSWPYVDFSRFGKPIH